VEAAGGGTLEITGPTQNQGILSAVGGGTVLVSSSLTSTGIVRAEGGGKTVFNGSLSIDNSGSLSTDPSGTVSIKGDLLGNTTNVAEYHNEGTVQLDGWADATAPHLFEVMAGDLGGELSGSDHVFTYVSLALGSGNFVRLTDLADNTPGEGAEALYVHHLVVPWGATLDLAGYRVYASATEIQGQILNGVIDPLVEFPRVIAQSPEITSDPVKALRLEFNQPMNEASFTWDDLLSFQGPNGAVVPTAYRWVAPGTLEITFDEQRAMGAAYRMVLGPQLQGSTGHWMDQDGDFIWREDPDDRYTAAFTIAYTGTFSEDRTWSPEDGLIAVDGPLTIAAGATLTIEPGTIVKFTGPQSRIMVEGNLEARGTAAQPVVFTSLRDDAAGGDTNNDGDATSPSRADWSGIYTSATGAHVDLDHAVVRYADYGVEILADNSSWRVSNSVISNNNIGLGAHHRKGLAAEAVNTLIADNWNTGVYFHEYFAGILRNCTIVGNGFAGGWAAAGVHQVGTLIMENCIVAFNRNGFDSNADPNLEIQNSLFYNPAGNELNVASDVLSRNGNIIADPLFVDIDARNYELAARSPAIDAGRGIDAPDSDMLGRPRFDDPGMANLGAGYPSYVDIGAFEQQDTTQSRDLAVIQVSAPQPRDVGAGDTFTVTWTVENKGQVELSDAWTDAIYLSSDPNLSPGDDYLLATMVHAGGLSLGETYSQTWTGAVPETLAGPQYVLVYTNAQSAFRESKFSNNVRDSQTALAIDVPDLVLDSPVAGSLDQGEWQFYRFEAQAGRTVRFVFDSEATDGAARLYVRCGAPPTASAYDAAGLEFNQPDQEARLLAPVAGEYYVGIFAYRQAGAGAYTLTAQYTTLDIRQASPNQVGKAGTATVKILGDGFTDQSEAQLVGPGGETIESQEWFQDAATLYATFDLASAGASPGVYDLVVTNAGAESVTASGAVTVVRGGAAQLQTDLVVPSLARPGRKIEVRIDYANAGNVDMASPLFTVESTDELTWTVDELRELLISQYSQDNPLSMHLFPPEMFAEFFLQSLDHQTLAALLASLTTQVTVDSVSALGISKEGPVSILRPGESYSLTLEVKTPFEPGDIPFTLYSFGEPGDKGLSDHIDWDQVETDVRPPDVASEAWAPLFARFQAQVGTTWGDYLAMLRDNADHLAEIGHRVYDAAELASFEFIQAGEMGTPTYLTSHEDAYCPAPGLSLSFERYFLPGPFYRARLGALGRGWTHSYEITLQERSDGSVVINGPGGLDRIFEHDAQGVYQASPGDYGTLEPQTGGGFLLTEKHGLEYSFRPDGLFAWIEDPDGNRITAGYDTAGRLTEVVHSSGDRFTFTYDADGRLETLTDHAGRVTRFDYDSSGKHLVSVMRPDGEATTYTYLTGEGVLRNHHLTSIAAPGAPVIHFSYDDLGRIEQYSLGAGAESTTYVYSTVGKTSVADALGHTTTVWLDSDGRPARVENPLGEAVELHYDAASNLVAVVGPDGTASYLAYDAAGNLVGTQDPMGYVTAFGYDEAYSNLAWVRDARGNMTNYDYDAAGNLASITYADQTVESYGYDAWGNPNAWTNRRGQTIAYTYNDRGQLVEKAYPDGAVLAYAYDDAGRLVSAEDAGGATTLQYDPDNGWLTKITYPEGRWLEYEYNDLGQRTQMRTHDGSVTNYRYDEAGRLAQLTDGAGQNIDTYTYDVAGRLIREDKGNGTYATYEYDAASQILDLTNRAPDGAPQSYFRYGYDALGRRTQMATHYGTWTYQYDASGQLTRAVLDSTDPAIPDQDLAYEYDPVGNRIRTIVNGEVTEYTTNDMNQYTEVGAAAYSYDADGNLIAEIDGGITTTYAYDFDNRLVGVTTPTETWSYAYDFLGNRVTSAQNGTATEYLIDPWGLGDVVAEYDQAGSAIARYSHGYGLLSRTDATGAPAYYAFDAIGSTSALTDAAGAVVNWYAYDPFGGSLDKSETLPNPFEFVGQYGVTNETNGFEFMRTRFYDSRSGRFNTPDPLRSPGENPHVYVRNAPSMLSDPLGLQAQPPTVTLPKSKRDMVQDAINAARRDIPLFSWPWYLPPWPRPGRNFPGWPLGPATLDYQPMLDTWEDFNDEYGQPTNDMPSNWGEGLYFDYDGFLEREWPDHGGEPTDSGSVPSRGSSTPEDKFGPAGYDPSATPVGSEQRFVAGGEALDYRIEFWNKPDAPVPTQYAYVEDTLDPSVFDLSTFEFTRFGFLEWDVPLAGGQAIDTRVDLRPDMNIAVDVTAELNPETGKVTWAFRCVDPLTADWPEDPMAGFLPPFNPETGYELGWVEFRVETKTGLSSGTRIENQAFVEFDMLGDLYDHPAPKQGPWVNTIDAGLPTSNVVELPRVSLSADFVVNWTGHDDTGGSGISTYEVFVSDDGGDWERWRERTPETSATFPGEPGHTYRFYSVARDNVGLEEAAPPPDTFDTLTTVLRFPWQNPVEPCDVNGQDGVTPLDVLLIINFINAHPGFVGLPGSPAVPPPFYNVNGDNAIVPLDVLLVINYINSHPAGSGEGERLGATALTAAGDIDAESPGESTTLPGRTTTDDLGPWQPRWVAAWPSALTTHPGPGEYIARSAETHRVQDAMAPAAVAAQSQFYLAERHDSRRWSAAGGQEYLSEPALFDDFDLELALTAIAADVADEWSQ
jgi:RHS repeat-associated protein